MDGTRNLNNQCIELFYKTSQVHLATRNFFVHNGACGVGGATAFPEGYIIWTYCKLSGLTANGRRLKKRKRKKPSCHGRIPANQLLAFPTLITVADGIP